MSEDKAPASITRQMSIPPPAAAFRLDVFPDPATGRLFTQISIDGVPIGCVHELSIDATFTELWPRGRVKVAVYNREGQAASLEKLRAVPWLDLEEFEAELPQTPTP